MAVTIQTKDFTAKTFPFQQNASFNATRYSTVPWGQAIVNESFQTTAIGAGDTGSINIDIGLPSDYVAMLRTMHLQVVDTATINWFNAMMGFAYQTPGGPYKNSVAEYPEDEYSWYQLVSDDQAFYDRFGATRHVRFWQLGNYYTGTNAQAFVSDAWDPTQVPLWIPPTVDTTFKDRSVVMFIDNGGSNQPAAEMTVRASFDLYTFEQAYSAAVMSSPRVFS